MKGKHWRNVQARQGDETAVRGCEASTWRILTHQKVNHGNVPKRTTPPHHHHVICPPSPRLAPSQTHSPFSLSPHNIFPPQPCHLPVGLPCIECCHHCLLAFSSLPGPHYAGTHFCRRSAMCVMMSCHVTVVNSPVTLTVPFIEQTVVAACLYTEGPRIVSPQHCAYDARLR